MRTTARRHGQPRRALGVVGLALVLSGCETYPITREPDPPLGAFGWLLVALAVALAGTVWIGVALLSLVGRRRLSRDRLLLGGSWVVATLGTAGWAGFGIAQDTRVDSILGGAGCRALPLAERPRQIVQLTCTEGGLDGDALLIAIFALPAVLLGLACAVMALRGDARPWLPTLLAAAGAVGLVVAISGSGGTWSPAGAAMWLAGAACAVTGTLAGGRVLRSEPAAPLPSTGPPVSRVDGALQAAGFADRLQALAIDGLLLVLPLVLLADNTSGIAEGLACMGLVVAYLVGATVATGQTIGKHILRLRIVSMATGAAPDLPTAVTRVAVLLVAPTYLLLSDAESGGALVLLWVGLTAGPIAWPARRGLHDLLAGTRVVRVT